MLNLLAASLTPRISSAWHNIYDVDPSYSGDDIHLFCVFQILHCTPLIIQRVNSIFSTRTTAHLTCIRDQTQLDFSRIHKEIFSESEIFLRVSKWSLYIKSHIGMGYTSDWYGEYLRLVRCIPHQCQSNYPYTENHRELPHNCHSTMGPQIQYQEGH